MSHLLKPLLLLLVLPPVPMLLLVFVGAGLMRSRPRWGMGVLIVATAGIWLSCTEGAAQWLSVHVLHVPPALDAGELEAWHAESRAHGDVAVLVLGGGAKDFTPEYGESDLKPLTLERLRYGVWLARQVEAPLGYTGGIGWGASHLHVSEASIAQRVAAEEFKLPLRWAESRSRDTRENAEFTLPTLEAAGVHKVLLVTHGTHMPRAFRDFEAVAGGKVEIKAAPMSLRRDAMSSWQDWQDWCPDSSGLERVRYVVYERLALWAGH